MGELQKLEEQFPSMHVWERQKPEKQFLGVLGGWSSGFCRAHARRSPGLQVSGAHTNEDQLPSLRVHARNQKLSSPACAKPELALS